MQVVRIIFKVEPRRKFAEWYNVGISRQRDHRMAHRRVADEGYMRMYWISSRGQLTRGGSRAPLSIGWSFCFRGRTVL